MYSVLNGCPCGHLTDSRHRCRCTHAQIQRYLAKISGPLLDRIDLHIDVPAVPFDLLSHRAEGESSALTKRRVVKARARQRRRLKSSGLFANAQMRHREIQQRCVMADDAKQLLKSAMEQLALSARAYDKILKIARTISDLAEVDTIQPDHLAEAIQYRSLDRQWWG